MNVVLSSYEINKFSDILSNFYVSHAAHEELWGVGGEIAQ
jgi:hypothetical protein